MKAYLVTWTIDVEAGNAREAAARALEIQRNNDPANIATVFDVQEYFEAQRFHGPSVTIDLSEPDDGQFEAAASAAGWRKCSGSPDWYRLAKDDDNPSIVQDLAVGTKHAWASSAREACDLDGIEPARG